MIGFPLGLLYSNAGEWFIHRYVLHGLRRNKRSLWSFHWHDHHMGPNQEANWCVTQPWFDYVMGTRELYAGTPREARDWGRHNAHQSLR